MFNNFMFTENQSIILKSNIQDLQKAMENQLEANSPSRKEFLI